MGAPTMADVGRAAGVSVASVSRALSDRTLFSSGLHKRMIAAVTQVGYRPQRTHKSTFSPSGIVLLVTHIAQQFYTQVTIDIEELAVANGSMPFLFRFTNGKEHMPQNRIGRQMVSLLEELAGNSSHDYGATIVNCSLIVRRSTGPAPGQMDSSSIYQP